MSDEIDRDVLYNQGRPGVGCTALTKVRLLAAGMDPYGEPTWLLGWSYEGESE